MSTVLRAVWVNAVEPAPLSLRVPSGMETRLAVSFFTQQGPVATDLLAQLELTGRSGNTPRQFYSMPATDVVNGKARAIIPAGDLTDPNGYRLNLYGTVDGEPMLLANGRVDVLAAAGPQAVPPDVIDQIALAFQRDEDVLIDVKLWTDASKDAPFDLTASGTIITANVYAVQGGPALVPFTVTVLAANEVRLTLTADQVNLLPDSCWWSLAASTAAGLTTLCEGAVAVSGIATPPLTVTTLNFDYQKPAAAADPASGQIVHSSITQDVLQIATTTSDVIDALPTLQLLRVGDQIIIGATTWSIAYIVAGAFYRVGVSPVQQAAPTGITPVTFQRP